MFNRAQAVQDDGPHAEVTPVVFDGMAGALYRPGVAARRGVVVLLCGPVGREARSAQRPLHLWAQRLADRGLQVLRYDHLGEGDSAPLPKDADQWRAWRQGLAAAARFARQHSGASQLVVCGLRIGAALALSASEEVQPDGLMLLAPILTGEAWLRDLRLAAIVQGAPATLDGSVQVDGLRLSPQTVASLEAVDVRGAARTWRAAFLAGARPNRQLAETLGEPLTARSFEGLPAFFKEAHVNEPPLAVFDAAGDWLESFAARAPAAKSAPPPPPAELLGPDWCETPVCFGTGLRGVLTLPQRRGARQAVVIGNTAADPRAGVGGFAARACRELASNGVAALRMDFAGVGESEAPGEDWRTHVYESSRVADFAAAAEVLRARGYDTVTLLGVCTGGFHAVDAVLAGAFDRAIAVNSWLLWRADTMPLEIRAQAALASPKTATTAMQERPLARLRASLVRKLDAFARAQRPDALCRGVRRRFRAAGARGARIHLIFGRGDASVRWQEPDFGLNCAWLAGQRGVTVSMRSGLDHALFSEESQTLALEEIVRVVAEHANSPASALRLPDLTLWRSAGSETPLAVDVLPAAKDVGQLSH